METSILTTRKSLPEFKQNKKKQVDFKLDFMESLMIKLHQTGLGKGFNEDEGRRIYTKQWDPLLAHLRKKIGLDKETPAM